MAKNKLLISVLSLLLMLAACGGGEESVVSEESHSNGGSIEESKESVIEDSESEDSLDSQESEEVGLEDSYEDDSEESSSGENGSESDPMLEDSVEGKIFTEPRQIGDVIEIESMFGDYLEYKVEKVYFDDDAYKLLGVSKEEFAEKNKKYMFEGLSENVMVVEVSETYQGNRDFGDETYSMLAPASVSFSSHRGADMLHHVAEISELDKDLEVGDSRKLYYSVSYQGELQYPKFIFVEYKEVVDVMPEIEMDITQLKETKQGVIYHSDGTNATQEPVFETSLTKIETGDSVKAEYEANTEGYLGDFSEDDDLLYVKATYEMTSLLPEDGSGKQEVVNVTALDEGSSTFPYVQWAQTISLENKAGDKEDDKLTAYINPGETKELTVFLIFPKGYPQAKYLRYLKLYNMRDYSFVTFYLDY